MKPPRLLAFLLAAALTLETAVPALAAETVSTENVVLLQTNDVEEEPSGSDLAIMSDNDMESQSQIVEETSEQTERRTNSQRTGNESAYPRDGS